MGFVAAKAVIDRRWNWLSYFLTHRKFEIVGLRLPKRNRKGGNGVQVEAVRTLFLIESAGKNAIMKSDHGGI